MRFMYFGTKRLMRWVKVDAPGRAQGTAGYSERLDYLNGGVGLRESVNAHQEFTLTWNSMTRDQARAVTDFAYGIYGSGPIYFVDPVSADQNILNPAWSAPGLTAKDAVPLAGRKRPKLVANPDLSRGYPIDMARYDLTAADPRRSFYIPIPPGFTALIGAHGDTASTLDVSVQRTTGGQVTGSHTAVPMQTTGDKARFSSAYVSTGDQSGIEISIGAGDGFISLAGLMVQVMPNGTFPLSLGEGFGDGPFGNDAFGGADIVGTLGDFILGQGASGCQFEGKPQMTPYSLAHDRVGLSVKLTEIEDWL